MDQRHRECVVKTPYEAAEQRLLVPSAFSRGAVNILQTQSYNPARLPLTPAKGVSSMDFCARPLAT